MEFLGKISVYYKSQKSGFIEFIFPEKGELIFNIEDCSFERVEGINWVTFELKEQKSQLRAINIKSIEIQSEFDYIKTNWFNYDSIITERLISEYEDIFSSQAAYPMSYSDQDSRFCKNFDIVLKSDGRKKIIDLAQYLITSPNIDLKSKDYYFFKSILERVSIEESPFIDNCKDIIDSALHREFYSNLKELENEMSKVPSREDLSPVVNSFLQNLKPSITYTHIFEEGYSKTRYKWDGSEEQYIFPQKRQHIACSVPNKFIFNDVSIHWGYNRRIELLPSKISKESAILEVYSSIHNSKRLWNDLVDVYLKKMTKSILNFINKVCQNVLTEILQYLSTRYPIYGSQMFTWAEKWKERNNFFISSYEIKYFILNKSSLSTNWDKTFERIIQDKYEPFNRPEITGVNVVRLKKDLIDIYIYLYHNLFTMINENFSPHKIDVYDTATVYKNNMMLSADEKILLSVDEYCSNINIPISVTHIGDGAFNGCKNLKEINFLGAITHIGHDVFNYVNYKITGDLSQISKFGYNNSPSKITINGETKTITEWSYLFNKKTIDEIDINMNDIYINHEDE